MITVKVGYFLAVQPKVSSYYFSQKHGSQVGDGFYESLVWEFPYIHTYIPGLGCRYVPGLECSYPNHVLSESPYTHSELVACLMENGY